MLLLGDKFPNFSANTTEGEIDFHSWLGDSWGILFTHPSDFTPVCTTELAKVLNLLPEFTKRNTKVIGLSCDTVSAHMEWCKDIKNYAGQNEDEPFPYPIIEDKERVLATKLGMIDKDEVDHVGMPLTARAVFIVDPNKKFRLSLLYPATTGRNFDEILRVIDSLQLTDKAKVATPADWKTSVSQAALDHELEACASQHQPTCYKENDPKRDTSLRKNFQMGEPCMVLPTVPEDQFTKVFPNGVTVVPVPSGKSYLRMTPCPKP